MHKHIYIHIYIIHRDRDTYKSIRNRAVLIQQTSTACHRKKK